MISLNDYYNIISGYNDTEGGVQVVSKDNRVEIFAQSDLQTTASGLYNQLEAHAGDELILAKAGTTDDGRHKYIVSPS